MLFWALTRYYWYFRVSEYEVNHALRPEEFKHYHGLLNHTFPYYSKLSDDAKYRFVGRMVVVLQHVPIVGREGMDVTDYEKTFIAASITQLSFGFNKAHIPFLKGVILYTDIFYSRLLENWVKGLSMGNGLVFMSYAHFEDGYRDTQDTYNLGLHEFAHVLRFQANELSFFDERLVAYFDEWERVGTPIFMQTRSREQDFFREYGGTNSSEFFSVCIENFFEVPHLFKQELPELYYHLCYLMKQNPLNETGDYAFNREDIINVNNDIKESLPIYKLWNTQHELFALEMASSFIIIAGIIAVIVFANLSIDNQFVAFRGLVTSTGIMFVVRGYYYRNIRAILNKQYVLYFLTRMIPILAFITILYTVM
jgi:MtfA peptidase